MSRIHEALKRAEREKGRPLPVEETGGAVGRASVAESPAAPALAPDVDVSPLPAAVAETPSTPAAAMAAAVASATGVHRPVAEPPSSALPARLESCRRAQWHEDRSRLFFLGGRGHSFGTEQLRTLRSRLYDARQVRTLKTVLVTSAAAGEGKTFVCANLAYACARQAERRVLLIDADLRSSRLHSLLGAPMEPGLTAFLRGAAHLEQVLQRGPHENLFFIPGGKPASNPAELLAGGKLRDLFRELTPLFDWILVDSPAAGSFADALSLAGCCDGTLLVVEGAKTPYDLAQSVTRELRSKRMLGVVLNRMQPSGN